MKDVPLKQPVLANRLLCWLAMLSVCGTSALGQFPGGGFPGGGGGNNRSASTSGGLQAATQVTAVADEYSNSLIILAPDTYQQAISNLVASLDVPVQDVTELRVFTLMNSDPTEMAQVLTSLFPDTSTSTTSGRGPGFQFGGRGGASTTSNDSDRSKRQSKVLAVADPRTSSVIVSASKDLMEQIVPMIAKLDESGSKKQKVFVHTLGNADSAEVEAVLKNLFETQNTRNGRTTQTSQQNALSQRQNNSARNQGTPSGSGLGNSSRLGGGGGLGGTGR